MLWQNDIPILSKPDSKHLLPFGPLVFHVPFFCVEAELCYGILDVGVRSDRAKETNMVYHSGSGCKSISLSVIGLSTSILDYADTPG